MNKHRLIGIHSWRFSKDSPFKCFACGKDIPNGGRNCLECDPTDPKFLFKPCVFESIKPEIYSTGGYSKITNTNETERLLKNL